MIRFDRYAHVNDLIHFYLAESPDLEISCIIESGITNKDDAELFSKFIWEMVEHIHRDEELGREVLGRTDNTDMLRELSYEVTTYMRKAGFYSIWEQASDVDK